MGETLPVKIESIFDACRSNLEAIGESLSNCCETGLRLSAGDTVPLANCLALPGLKQPGLVVSLGLGTGYLLGAIPESLPLPDWYRQPNREQQSRLGTLAMEWSLTCLPADVSAQGFSTVTVPDILAALEWCEPASSAQVLPLLVSSGDAVPTSGLWLVGPAAKSLEPQEAPSPVTQRGVAAPANQPMAEFPPAETSPNRGESAVRDAADPIARLLGLPVRVSVRLAEKKIEVGQLLSLGPGAIVTFEKSCEDLLELYVNNQLYGRGEAVKIGEKFGLKVSEVGSRRQRASTVFGLR